MAAGLWMNRDVDEDVAGSDDAEGVGGAEATVDAEGPPTSLEKEVDATFPFSIAQQKSNRSSYEFVLV
jgi:hypothetical protein